jgi:hypothetical protein
VKQLVISVDFDGTIVKSKYPEIGKLRWLAKPVLRWLKQQGHILILNTCRQDKALCNCFEGDRALTEARMFLHDNGIDFDYCNHNARHLIDQYGDCRKIGADLYLDDKAFFPGWWIVPLVVLWMEFTRRNEE